MSGAEIGFCPVDTSVAVQYGQTIVIGIGLLLGLAMAALYRHRTRERKYQP